jgi:hypothetical protein
MHASKTLGIVGKHGGALSGLGHSISKKWYIHVQEYLRLLEWKVYLITLQSLCFFIQPQDPRVICLDNQPFNATPVKSTNYPTFLWGIPTIDKDIQ